MGDQMSSFPILEKDKKTFWATSTSKEIRDGTDSDETEVFILE